MEVTVMTKNSESSFLEAVNHRGAKALLTATVAFLRANNIPKRLVIDCIRQNYGPRGTQAGIRKYHRLALAYQEMGIVMSTWYSSTRYLDSECRPLPLTIAPGQKSIAGLVRASRVSISTKVAIALMRRSTSIKIDDGKIFALRREFVVPDFEVLRAALIIERYLETLHGNFSSNRNSGMLLLERSCHVPEVDLRTITPVLRDIKRRGSAYIDSVNGDIESLRPKRIRSKGTGEMSVHIFAWTRVPKARKELRPARQIR
jgi:hypothetical protein